MLARTCSVDGCSSVYYSKGMCRTHYYRVQRHGHTNATRAEAGEPARFLENVVFKHKNKNACLIWPHSRTDVGYAQLVYKGELQGVHRIVCEKINGKAPVGKSHALHSCGQGKQGCINPRHLYWGTPKKNAKDRDAHRTTALGEKHGRSVLVVQDVRKILRRISRGYSDYEIADRFEVSTTTIRNIRIRKTWRHVSLAS